MNKLKTSLGLVATAAALVTSAMAQTVETLPPAAQPTAPAQPAPMTSPAMRAPATPAITTTTTTVQGQAPTTGQQIPQQGLQGPGGTGLPPAPKVQTAGSIQYINGGAGFEARDVIEGSAQRFSLHNVFSGKGGEYVVAERVSVRGADGVAVEIPNAGPLLSIALPPGKYTIEATVDGRLQKKTVSVAQTPVRLNWNWPGA